MTKSISMIWVLAVIVCLFGSAQQQAIAAQLGLPTEGESAAPLPVSPDEILGLSFAQPKNKDLVGFDQLYAARLSLWGQVAGVRNVRLYDLLTTGAVGPPLLPALALYAADEKVLQPGVKQPKPDDLLSDIVDHDSLVTVQMKPHGAVMWAHDVKGADPTPLGGGLVRDYLFLVFSDPATPPQEAAYNDWYDHQHLADVLRVPGFLAAQRFITVSASDNSKLPKYLVVFVLRSGDLAATNAEIGRRLRTGITVPSKTMSSGIGAFFKPRPPAISSASQAR
jgi:hypothetical protein